MPYDTRICATPTTSCELALLGLMDRRRRARMVTWRQGWLVVAVICLLAVLVLEDEWAWDAATATNDQCSALAASGVLGPSNIRGGHPPILVDSVTGH